ncbi:uncharacterized protein LY89DRAFT_414764 [Mollisia scopiformis]|uniref:Uncharacterized protein n=1 Tax=Mollisia scopiformis TaxID=149040 RepID=A0A132B3N1_MOLSC|nr:uncharacterized protein LY89DRAFT_414764 [Mollisia scopiformis]KUJ06277.1 hypothetical protein LY89DRAFT_414764 [Mollisia scopiformis]
MRGRSFSCCRCSSLPAICFICTALSISLQPELGFSIFSKFATSILSASGFSAVSGEPGWQLCTSILPRLVWMILSVNSISSINRRDSSTMRASKAKLPIARVNQFSRSIPKLLSNMMLNCCTIVSFHCVILVCTLAPSNEDQARPPIHLVHECSKDD